MYCRCCRMDNVFPPRPSNLGDLPQTPTICGLCTKHQGSMEIDLKRRDAAHIEQWKARLEETVEDLRAEAERTQEALLAQATDAHRLLSERPTHVVYENLDKQVVSDALAERDAAYQARDRIFRDMTKLHMLHFEATPETCRCGKPVDDCPEWALLDQCRPLRGWERHHTERRRLGKDHALPRNHPGIIDARWDPDDEHDFEHFPGITGGWD